MPKPFLVKSAIAALVLGLLAGYYSQTDSQGISPASQSLASASQPTQAPTPVKVAQSTPVAQPVQTNLSGAFMDQGQRRTYYLHTPPSYQTGQPLPLVLAFHESSGTGKDMAAHTGLNHLADEKGFMVVYPDGLNEKWNVSDKAATGEDNVLFVQALIAHLGQIRAIDHQRIYAAGLSNGGILVQKLACKKPAQIAAFATVAASLPAQFQPKCQNQTPISILMINGTADAVVPWDGGAPPDIHVGRDLSLPSIPNVINFWQQHDGCMSPPTVVHRSDKLVTTSSYTNCQAGSEVTLLTLNGASHIWPGGGYGTSPFVDASETIWDFFERHPMVTAMSQSVNATQSASQPQPTAAATH